MDEKNIGSEMPNAGMRVGRCVRGDGLDDARRYLESYRHGARMLRADRYAREYFSDLAEERDAAEAAADELDASLIRARLFEVRGFISVLECGEDGRALLYYHYIRGIPVAECAEMLHMSRAGAFRLRRAALVEVAKKLEDSEK